MTEANVTRFNRILEQARELGSSMLHGFAAANEGEAPYRALALRNPDSVLHGEFPSVSHLIELSKTIPVTSDPYNH